MRFLVPGITGNTGAAAALALLEQGHTVRSLVRDPSRAASWAERGVELIDGSIEVADDVAGALRDVDGVYLIVPPRWGAPDAFAATRVVIDAYLRALADVPVARVVVLSSVAVHLPGGTGPIATLRPLEAGLAEHAGATFVRAAYFHENFATSLDPVRAHGVLPVFAGAATRLEMVSAQDIGTEVARQLAIAPASARRIVNLSGPSSHSFVEVAETFSSLLGKTVVPVEQPLAALGEILRSMGAGHLGELYVEMTETMGRDGLNYEPGAEITRGTTPLRTSLARLLG